MIRSIRTFKSHAYGHPSWVPVSNRERLSGMGNHEELPQQGLFMIIRQRSEI